MAPSRIRFLSLLAFLAAISLSLVSGAHGQTSRPARSAASTEIKWDAYTFKFLPGNQMGQVLNANGQVIGTILSMNGELQVLPTVTGNDANALKKSFQDWKAQGGEKALASAAPQSARSRAPADGATTRGNAPSAQADPPATPARGSDSAASTPSATPPSAPPTATSPAFKYGILDAAAVDKLGKGAALRLDLNLLRLSPALLEQKFYMQYFIALNNCNDPNVAKMLTNELDYPDLAALYKPKVQEILKSPAYLRRHGSIRRCRTVEKTSDPR